MADEFIAGDSAMIYSPVFLFFGLETKKSSHPAGSAFAGWLRRNVKILI
jgi:hypothetical protein